jgi:hypothetical protein
LGHATLAIYTMMRGKELENRYRTFKKNWVFLFHRISIDFLNMKMVKFVSYLIMENSLTSASARGHLDIVGSEFSQ